MAQLDLDAVERLARGAPPLASGQPALFPPAPLAPRVALAVAQDEAFSFYYQDNLDLLAAWGAEIVPFSPLRDEHLPVETDGIFLGGGFPEVYAASLAANEALRRALRVASHDTVIYAECGGFMYLCRHLTDFEGRRWPMVGLLPAATRMQRDRPHLAYVTVRARRATPALPAGAVVRAHEFHWSVAERAVPLRRAAYEVLDQGGRLEGFAGPRLLASYVHLHFGTDARIAPRLVETCARTRVAGRPTTRGRGRVFWK
jgi:cobyrinic acid a,c-diamide synthase